MTIEERPEVDDTVATHAVKVTRVAGIALACAGTEVDRSR